MKPPKISYYFYIIHTSITEEITKTDEDCNEECSLPPSVPQ